VCLSLLLLFRFSVLRKPSTLKILRFVNVKIKAKTREPLVSFKKSERQKRKAVTITREVADSIITWAKTHHPNEAILILRGKRTLEQITVDGVVIPPFSESGPFYSGFMIHDLPYTIPHVGTAHSHPGGSNSPSLEDLNHFTGFVSIIISHPYEDNTMAAYDRNGNSLELKIVNSA
jgi:proteasome lid subunit RPN8/RPN11